MKRIKSSGSALVFTFILLTLLFTFVLSMQEIASSTAYITESSELDQEAENLAEVGVNYFILRVFQKENNLTLGNDPEQDYQNLMESLVQECMASPKSSGNTWTDEGEKWYPFGPDGGRFRLELLEILPAFRYRLVVQSQVPHRGNYHFFSYGSCDRRLLRQSRLLWLYFRARAGGERG